MKTNSLVAIIANKKGDCYQVALTGREERIVIDLISQLHNGKINITQPKLSLTIGRKK